jgi:hypothetical protein
MGADAGAGGAWRCMRGNGVVLRARRSQCAREALSQSLTRPFPVRGPVPCQHNV